MEVGLKVDTVIPRVNNVERLTLGNTDNVELGSPRNDGIDKVKIKMFHREVCEMGARCFPELCFAAVEDSSGNSMVMITQRTLNLHPPFGCMSQIQVSISGFQYEVHVMMKK